MIVFNMQPVTDIEIMKMGWGGEGNLPLWNIETVESNFFWGGDEMMGIRLRLIVYFWLHDLQTHDL